MRPLTSFPPASAAKNSQLGSFPSTSAGTSSSREDAEVLRRRRETMLEARRRHLERWITGRVLNCTPIKEVWLNPENGQLEEKHAKAA